MIKLEVFQSMSSFKWSNALDFNIYHKFYLSLRSAQHWRMGKGDTWDDAYECKAEVRGFFLSPLRYKFIPPLVPEKDNVLQSLKDLLICYLCKDCCSIKSVRMAKTTNGFLDIIECYAGAVP